MTALTQTDALKYILAGNSTFTVKNTESRNRFTFKVRKPKKKDATVHFVSVMSGTDSYQYLGTIFNSKDYYHGKKSKIAASAQSEKVFQYIFSKLITQRLSSLIAIFHSGTCGRCGRKLTVPESIISGIGPECAKRVD